MQIRAVTEGTGENVVVSKSDHSYGPDREKAEVEAIKYNYNKKTSRATSRTRSNSNFTHHFGSCNMYNIHCILFHLF